MQRHLPSKRPEKFEGAGSNQSPLQLGPTIDSGRILEVSSHAGGIGLSLLGSLKNLHRQAVLFWC